MTGYNYVDALKGTEAFAGVQSRRIRSSRYRQPQTFQIGRQFLLGATFCLVLE
jgi:hypothetical protein